LADDPIWMPRDVGKYFRTFMHPLNFICYTVQCSIKKKRNLPNAKMNCTIDIGLSTTWLQRHGRLCRR